MRRAHHIGRLRERAADILGRAFPEWDVRPWDISPATGSYRTCRYHDVYRWELFTRTKTGVPVVCGSWETLTEFVKYAAKYGCRVNDEREIYSNKGDKE